MTYRTDNNLRLARIRSEIRNSAVKVHSHYDIYICESNMALWKIVMQGPQESSYSDGTFLMYLEMEDDYPNFAPKARFLTSIYHPNINRHGLYSLLLFPGFSDPINAVVTLNFHWDQEEVALQIAKHATKTRAEWKKDIIGE
ncbi:UBC-like protein [Polyplosphaeria fusca]|uniref:UBC-like protein n=1 Tax=Polyplosphaeria fusca TaxID=682080 RepID=A0A9P4QPP1_9PLEO|nr:UBC-like protein [Polyplosphaeria fusca]